MRINSKKGKKSINAISKKKKDSLLQSDFKKEIPGSANLIEEKVLELNLEIDKKEYLTSDIDKIEVLISKEPLKDFTKIKALKQNNKNQKETIKSTNLKIKNINKVRRKNITEKYKKVFKLTEISPDKVIDASKSSIKKLEKLSDRELFGTVVKYVPRKIEKNASISQKKKQLQLQKKFATDDNATKEQQSQSNLINNLKVIKRNKKDLASLLQKNLLKSTPQSQLQRIKGTIDAGDKNTSSLNDKLTKKVKNIISKKTNVGRNSYTIEKRKIVNKNETVTKQVKIKNSVIKKITNEKDLNLIYQIKNKQGKVIKNISSTIDMLQEKKENNDIPELAHDINAYRRNNKIYVKISNIGNKPAYYNVYQKKNYDLFLEYNNNFEIISKKINLMPKTSKTIELSNHSGKSVFRALEVSKEGREYSNFVSDSIASINKSNLNSHAGMVPKVNEGSSKSKNISIFIKEIPNGDEYTGIQLFKRNLSKKEKHYKPVYDVVSEQYLISIASSKNIRLIDNDVHNGHIYEYKMQFYDSNKNKFLSSSTCIEEYETRTGIVQVNFDQDPLVNKNILTMTINVQILKNDADRLFESLFGNLYDLFKEDVKEIKDVNSLSTILDITMTNMLTGEIIEVGKFNVNENNRARVSVYLPKDHDYSQEYCIKIKPKIAPPADLLSTISKRIANLGIKENFNPVSQFSTPAIKKRFNAKEDNIVSIVGNKFTSRSNRLKGKIEDDNTFLNRSGFDFYFDGSTGDQLYYDLIPNKNIENVFLSKFSIKKINEKNIKLKYNRQQKIENNVNILIKASYNYNEKNNIDFFIAAIEENGIFKESGLAYSKNRNLNFLHTLLSPVGEIKFFFIPVFKDGSFGDKIMAGKKYFNSDGDMSNE